MQQRMGTCGLTTGQYLGKHQRPVGELIGQLLAGGCRIRRARIGQGAGGGGQPTTAVEQHGGLGGGKVHHAPPGGDLGDAGPCGLQMEEVGLDVGVGVGLAERPGSVQQHAVEARLGPGGLPQPLDPAVESGGRAGQDCGGGEGHGFS
ncbi:hypothetical protein ACIQNI_11640 [Streptomyces sp. NPDC091266]|uniref:hypothetical protein n=1 Tax=Streptomyces sp. NPDC091266 TaxID=3365978 RepID=UPI00381EF1C4